jgi:tRNA uridine 5-carboxymethylaminomethyl modification enzyme
MASLNDAIDRTRIDFRPLADILRNPEFTLDALRSAIGQEESSGSPALFTVHTNRFYEPYERKARADIARMSDLERKRIPADLDYTTLENLRAESRAALIRFKPETLGQASRLEGLTPADVMLLSMLIKKHRENSGNRPQPTP